jgi:hypothetical protein
VDGALMMGCTRFGFLILTGALVSGAAGATDWQPVKDSVMESLPDNRHFVSVSLVHAKNLDYDDSVMTGPAVHYEYSLTDESAIAVTAALVDENEAMNLQLGYVQTLSGTLTDGYGFRLDAGMAYYDLVGSLGITARKTFSVVTLGLDGNLMFGLWNQDLLRELRLSAGYSF